MSKIGCIRVSTGHQETARQSSEQVQTKDHVRLFSMHSIDRRPHLLREYFGEHAKCFAICYRPSSAQGKYTGRKPIEIDWTKFGQLYGEWKSKCITGRDFMRRMVSVNLFMRSA